jgi:hypothetical protein
VRDILTATTTAHAQFSMLAYVAVFACSAATALSVFFAAAMLSRCTSSSARRRAGMMRFAFGFAVSAAAFG